MRERRSEYDVTNRVRTTDPTAVSTAVAELFCDLYPGSDPAVIDRYLGDFTALYAGERDGYDACDAPYHDLQHMLEVALATARIVHGYERSGEGDPLGERMFRLALLLGLAHDSGYIRHRKDSRHAQGAEYTLIHVSRSGLFLREYLPEIGMADLAAAAARIVHYTGYEMPVRRIRAPGPVYHTLGCLVACADLQAQMADRCYLEKCYDRLYVEFLLGGVARRIDAHGREEIVYASAADLLRRTPQFIEGARRRMAEELDGHDRFMAVHFGGTNPYRDEIDLNLAYARLLRNDDDMARLRRRPPRPVARARQLSLI